MLGRQPPALGLRHDGAAGASHHGGRVHAGGDGAGRGARADGGGVFIVHRRQDNPAGGAGAAIIALGYHLSRTGRATDPRFASWGAVVPQYVGLAQKRAQMK